MTIDYPTKERAIRALLLAPLLPVGILFVFDAVDRTMQFGPLYIVGAALLAFYILIFVEVFSFVLGGAVLVALWRRIPFNFFVCCALGGFVAALPFVVFGLLPDSQPPVNYDAWLDGREIVIDGVKTAYGRWQDLISILQIAALGVVGGGFFWWLCRPKSVTKIDMV